MTGINSKEDLNKILAHPSLTKGEKTLLGWQYHFNGDFMKGLWGGDLARGHAQPVSTEGGLPVRGSGIHRLRPHGRLRQKVRGYSR